MDGAFAFLVLGLGASDSESDVHDSPCFARQDRQERPFGGINIIFAGDLWQLPPVKGKAIFGNPFRSGLTAGEQKIAKMFWMIKDPIHRLFELTVPLRSTDEWLKADLGF